ncbi:MAG TPA: hypothetical protein VF941_01925 [Clostridia bacterium]
MSAVNQFEKIGYYNADVLGLNAKTTTATSNEIYTPGPGNHSLLLRVTIASGTGSIVIKPQCSMQGNANYADVLSNGVPVTSQPIGLSSTLTGSVTFAASTAVTGTGTKFLTEVPVGSQIKLSTDSDTVYATVVSVADDTHLTLSASYTGTAGSGSAYRKNSSVQEVILKGISNWTKLVVTVTGTITYTVEAEIIETPRYTPPSKWTYFVTAISAIVHNFPTSRSQVRVSNHNTDSAITLIINNNTLKPQVLRPGSVVDLTRVSSISMQSVSSPGLVAIEILEHKQPVHLLTYGGNSKQVIAASGSVAYAATSTKLYKSTDGLATWSASLIDITPDYFTAGVVKDNGTVIMWTNGGRIYRSTDGNTFTLIDTTVLCSLTGTASFTNGNTAVTGTSTKFLTEVAVGSYIKLGSDSDSVYAAVSTVNSDTSITLSAVYAGTSGSGTVTKRLNPPLWHGMDYNGNTIVFGEYNTTAGNYKLITSTNDGLTWTATLTKVNPGEIRHWHSINYFPIEGYFLATSGDTATQVTWWKSADGATWTQVPNITGTANGQDFRGLNFQYIGNGQIMWSSDATGQQVSIFKASLTDPSGTKTKVTDLDHTSWGLMFKNGLYVVVTRVETGDGDNYALIYTSTDGVNYSVDMKWPITQGQTNGGFGSIYYLDTQKLWMFPVQNLAYSTPNIFTVTGS